MSGAPAGPSRDRPAAIPARAAPAKINLALEVIGRRPDGFHELRSVFAPLALADELRVTIRATGRGAARPGWQVPPAPSGSGCPVTGLSVAVDGRADGATLDGLTITGASDVPVDDNLVLRAASLLRAGTDRPLAPLAFRLRKRIPAAAGLGGGSSDALAALDLAAAAWGLRLPSRRRLELAGALGSDVPFFALGGWALVGGRGERLVRLPPPVGGPIGVLLVVPASRLATRDVFAVFDAVATGHAGAHRPTTQPAPAGRLAALLRRGASPAEIADVRPSNDLFEAAAALLPGLDRLRRQLGDALGRTVHLSGSGPSLFVLYPSPREARRAASAVRAAVAAGSLRPPGGALRAIPTATTGGEA